MDGCESKSILHHLRDSGVPDDWPANTNKRYGFSHGFSHGFQVVQDFVHPQYVSYFPRFGLSWQAFEFDMQTMSVCFFVGGGND